MTELKNIFVSPQFWGILVPAFVGIWTFSRSKTAERESEWRKEKLKLYLNFVSSLSGITDSEISTEGEIRFAKACNDLHALSPNTVLKALHNYQGKMSIRNTSSTPSKKQQALSALVREMRKDLKIKSPDSDSQFEMRLWTSGKTLEQ